MARSTDTQSLLLLTVALGLTGGLLAWGSARKAQASDGPEDDDDPSPDDAPGLGEDDEVPDGGMTDPGTPRPPWQGNAPGIGQSRETLLRAYVPEATFERSPVPLPGYWYTMKAGEGLLELAKRTYGVTSLADRQAGAKHINEWNPWAWKASQGLEPYPLGVIDARAKWQANPLTRGQVVMPGSSMPTIYLPLGSMVDTGIRPLPPLPAALFSK